MFLWWCLQHWNSGAHYQIQGEIVACWHTDHYDRSRVYTFKGTMKHFAGGHIPQGNLSDTGHQWPAFRFKEEWDIPRQTFFWLNWQIVLYGSVIEHCYIKVIRMTHRAQDVVGFRRSEAGSFPEHLQLFTDQSSTLRRSRMQWCQCQSYCHMCCIYRAEPTASQALYNLWSFSWLSFFALLLWFPSGGLQPSGECGGAKNSPS